MRRNLVSILFIVLIALSSCSNTTLESESFVIGDSIVGQESETSSEFVEIQSDNVRAADYDRVAKILTIEFKNGSVYQYYEVPEALWKSFLLAQPNPWSEVGYPQLVQGGYSYKRLP